MNAKKLVATLAALTFALLFAAMAGLNNTSAQSPVDYDTDDDGLIEIECKLSDWDVKLIVH